MENCLLCSEQIEPPDKLKCTYCCKLFHYRCGGILKTALKIINENESIFWVCDGCKRFPAVPIIRILEEQMALIKEHDILLKKLCEKRLTEVSVEKENVEKLYSAALKSTSAVIIKPNNPLQKNLETKGDILHGINPVETQINITSVKNIKNGGIVVGCNNIEDVSKFKNIAKEKLGDKYEIKDAKKLSPRIRVVGMTEKYEEDVLINHVKYQNKNMLSDQCECTLIKFWPTKRNKNVFQAILQVDVASYNNIMTLGNGKLFVGYDYCEVYDSILLLRCYKCNGYNHVSGKCNNKRSCAKCANDHEIKNCTEDAELKCINCVKYLEKANNSNISINHAAWDSHCPVYCQKVEEFKSSMYMNK